MNAKKNLDLERKKYANEWVNDGKHFYEKNYYKWMREHISDKINIFEIGCGSGWSTLFLAQNGHRIVSIDENLSCLEKTHKLLQSNGFKSKVIKRGHFKENSFGIYEINYGKINRAAFEEEILLIEADIINDDKLLQWLNGIKNINSIICWLIGSHGARRYNKKIGELNLQTPQDYRFNVQNRVYEIADEILNDEGVLHIVDRGKFPSSVDEEKEYKLSHDDQASVTDLKIIDLDFLRYDSVIQNGVDMSLSDGNKIIKRDSDNEIVLSLVSVISKK